MNLFAKAICYILALFFSLTGGIGEMFPPKEHDDFRVCAYLVANDADAVQHMDVTHLKDVTDIILIGSLASFGVDGQVRLAGDFDEIMTAVKEKTRGTGVKIHLNFGGPGAVGGETWEDQMDSMSAQHKLAFDSGMLEENIRRVLDRYALDGVFFDYEYPLTDQRKREYGDFIVRQKAALGDRYLLGCALSSWCAALPKEAIRAIDRVELMAYDLWDPITGAHASYSVAAKTVREMLLLGYTRAQIDLGLPFYARPTTKEAIWYDYADCVDRIDRIGLMPDEENGVTASFNTPDLICAKTRFAVRKKLGGVMIWHYGCDVPADHEASLFNAIAKAKGR